MGKRNEGKLHIDLPFGEALERYIGTKPEEVEGNIARAKKKKPPRAKKTRSGPSDAQNVTSLRDARQRRRNRR